VEEERKPKPSPPIIEKREKKKDDLKGKRSLVKGGGIRPI